MKTDPILDHLRSLPDAPLPDTLWPRLQQRQRTRVARQRRAFGAGLCAVTLGLTLSLMSVAPPPSSRSPQPGAPIAHLQAVDRALQAAYANGASDDELSPLWDIRERLLSHTTTQSRETLP